MEFQFLKKIYKRKNVRHFIKTYCIDKGILKLTRFQFFQLFVYLVFKKNLKATSIITRHLLNLKAFSVYSPNSKSQ